MAELDSETYCRVFRLVFKDFTRVMAWPLLEEHTATKSKLTVPCLVYGSRQHQSGSVWIGPLSEDIMMQTQLTVEMPSLGPDAIMVDVTLDGGESGRELQTAIAKRIVEKAKGWQGIRVSFSIDAILVEAKSLEELLVLADLNGNCN